MMVESTVVDVHPRGPVKVRSVLVGLPGEGVALCWYHGGCNLEHYVGGDRRVRFQGDRKNTDATIHLSIGQAEALCLALQEWQEERAKSPETVQ